MYELGSKFYFYKNEVFKPWFAHPSDESWKIYTFLDAPHAAKCVRGAMKVWIINMVVLFIGYGTSFFGELYK